MNEIIKNFTNIDRNFRYFMHLDLYNIFQYTYLRCILYY